MRGYCALALVRLHTLHRVHSANRELHRLSVHKCGGLTLHVESNSGQLSIHIDEGQCRNRDRYWAESIIATEEDQKSNQSREPIIGLLRARKTMNEGPA